MALTKIKTQSINDDAITTAKINNNAVTDAKVADDITAGAASTAATLATARSINGVSFNGSSAITVTAAAGTLTGNTLASGVNASSLTSVGTLGSLSVRTDQDAETSISLQNANTGTAGHAELLLKNSNGNVGGLRAHSSGFTTSNSSEADGFTIESYRQILHLVASNDKDIKFWNGTSNNVTFANGGNATFAGIVQITDATDSNLKLSAEVADEVRLISINDADNAYKALKFYGSRFEFLSGPIGIGITAPETHGVTAGIHLADDYEIGFGNGANSRPDFGMSGYSSNLSIYCGEGSDTADILINTNGELGVGVAPSASGVHIYNDKAQSANLSAMSGHQLVLQTGSDTNDTASMGFYASGDGYVGACLTFERTGNSGTGDLSIKVRNDANETSGDEPSNVVTFNDDGDSVFGGNLHIPNYIYHSGDSNTNIQFETSEPNMIFNTDFQPGWGFQFKNAHGDDGVVYMAHRDTHGMHINSANATGSTYLFEAYGGGSSRFRIMGDGEVQVNESEVHSASDISLKKNISTITGALDKVNAMRGVKFKWKSAKDDKYKEHIDVVTKEVVPQSPKFGQYHIGLIAQEVEEILPEAVNTAGDGIKSISDGNQLSAVIIEAIKELTTRLQALENA